MHNPRKYKTLADLPDDPLKMPPPYWRSPGVVFQIEDALETLLDYLGDLPGILAETQERWLKHLEVYPTNDPDNEEAMIAFGEVIDPLSKTVHKIHMKIDLAMLMMAISLEDRINQFCVYNLHKDMADSIEKLDVPAKLLVACTALGRTQTKSDAAYEAVKKISSWRNAYVHGHCVDRPRNSTLRENHLIHPPSYGNVPKWVNQLIEHCKAYVRVTEYLRNASKNPYTSGRSQGMDKIEHFLDVVKLIKFESIGEDGQLYDAWIDIDMTEEDLP